MIKSSKKHLQESCTTYVNHFKFAVYASVLLIYAGVASIIHAFVPALFKGTAAFIVIKLYKERLVNHPNTLYKQWMDHDNH